MKNYPSLKIHGNPNDEAGYVESHNINDESISNNEPICKDPDSGLKIIAFIPLQMLDAKNKLTGTISINSPDDTFSMLWDVNFVLSTDKSCWKSDTITINSLLMPRNSDCQISVRTYRGIISGTRKLNNDRQVLRKINADSAPIEMVLVDERIHKLHTVKNMSKAVKITIVAIALLIGLVCGWLLRSIGQAHDDEMTEQQTTATQKTAVEPVNNIATNKDAKGEEALTDSTTADKSYLTEKVSSLMEKLDSRDVTFIDIKNLHGYISDLTASGSEYPSDLMTKANNYYEVVLAIEALPNDYLNNDYYGQKIWEFRRMVGGKLSDQHLELVRNIYLPWADKNWTVQKLALEKLRSGLESGKVTAFTDLEKIKNEVNAQIDSKAQSDNSKKEQPKSDNDTDTSHSADDSIDNPDNE